MHMMDSMEFHDCGGVILSSGGEGEYDHYYCDGCGAFTYDPDPAAPFPTGTDRRANREAHDNGDYRSPDVEVAG